MTGRVRKAALPTAIATVLVFGALDTATAERAQSERNRDSQKKQSQTQQTGTRQAIGEVINVKNVDVRGTKLTTQVVHLKTDKNRRVIADLGSKDDSQLQKAKIQVGDRIGVRGQAVQIGDRVVLAAEQLRVKGQTYHLDRDRQSARLQKEMSAQQQARKETNSAEKEKMSQSSSRSGEKQAMEQDRPTASRAGSDASRYADNLQPREFRTQAERDLIERVNTRLKNDPQWASLAEDIQVSADLNGEITLRGQVSSQQEKEKLATTVQNIRGVNDVRNRLQVVSSDNMAKRTD